MATWRSRCGPKTGQSAYVVIPPVVAREIATRLLALADEQERMTATEGEDEASTTEAVADATLPTNIVDLSRRRRRPD